MSKNLQNLRNFTTETAREAGRKGAMKSAETKRRRKSVREALNILANSPVTNEKAKKILLQNGLKESDVTNAAAIAFSIITQAVKGNPKMTQIFLNLMGENTPTKIELTGAGGAPVSVRKENPLDGLTTDELRKLAGLE